jgi:hypothetical protein
VSYRIRPIAEKCVDELLGYTLRPPLATAEMKMVAAARRVALRDLSADQLRALITQGEGLTYLLPFALARLERDPLLEASSLRGDLLSAVLQAEVFWIARPEPRERIRAVIAEALARIATVRIVDGEMEPRLQTALARIEQVSAGR